MAERTSFRQHRQSKYSLTLPWTMRHDMFSTCSLHEQSGRSAEFLVDKIVPKRLLEQRGQKERAKADEKTQKEGHPA